MTPSDRPPRIRAVIVDFNGGAMTVECVQRVVAAGCQGADLEVVVVDNGSSVRVIEEIARRFPGVSVIESVENLGFGGGCNLTLRELAGVDYVALINNDLEVLPGWLEPLLKTMEAEPEIGAACPKILFVGQFLSLTMSCETRAIGLLDRRQVGVRFVGASSPDGRALRPQLVRGLFPPELMDDSQTWYCWSAAEALIRIPLIGGELVPMCRLELDADRPTLVRTQSGERVTEIRVGPGAGSFEVPLGGEPIDVVNNAGSILLPDGYGADRGFLEPDGACYDEQTEVDAWSGGAVLLRGDYLRDVGLFDARLFMYYEDLELSLRGAKQGWRYKYVPASVVRHRHAATAVEGSALAQHFNERNRLLVSLRHAGPGPTIRRVLRYLLATASYTRRDVLAPLARGRRPHGTVVLLRLRAAAAAMRLAPAMLRSRRQDRRQQRVRA